MLSQRSYLSGDFGFGILDCGFQCRGLRSGIGRPQTAIKPHRRCRTKLVGWALPTMRTRTMLVGGAHSTAFTLVEMLVAMAITLVMMAAVVTLFANVSSSIRDSRANLEMGAQIRGVRNVLQQDLAGATCPGLTWQRPESNHGYIELIEGPRHEGDASLLVNGVDSPPNDPELDHMTSIIPSSDPKTTPFKDPNWVTDGGGLGDADDILMLTVRNERKPFVGRVPDSLDAKNGFRDWTYTSVESPLAEVVWFAVENPNSDSNPNHFYGEPGMRTIYRRTLLIAPWLNPYSNPKYVDNNGLVKGLGVKPVPGLLRLLPSTTIRQGDVAEAIAALVAFQDRYDISCRVEWDYSFGHWKIVANTLGDLTKRENRFGHYGYVAGTGGSNPGTRIYPFPVVSNGSGYSGAKQDVAFVVDPEIGSNTSAKAEANVLASTLGVISYTVKTPGNDYQARPFAFVDKAPSGGVPATAWAMLNDDGQVVRVMHGPMPLWGTRRGEDVMLTNVLAFDLRVYDPGAPLFATWKDPTDQTKGLDVVLTPSDPGWRGTTLKNGTDGAYFSSDNMGSATGIGTNNKTFPYVGQGAYVDLGYGYDATFKSPNGPLFPSPKYAASFASSTAPWFFTPRALMDVFGNQLAPGYAVYDTWSFHYENNGINEDGDLILDSATNKWVPLIDEGTNGLDDRIPNGGGDPLKAGDHVDDVAVLGVDDAGERETTPPYDKPLRGIQVLLRSYELDSRAIRQVRVNQHFMAE